MNEILKILNANYTIYFDKIELLREGASFSYAVWSGDTKYFLRQIRPEILQTAREAIDVHIYLQQSGFAVPPIIHSKDGYCFYGTIADKQNLYILYEFIEASEPENVDAQRVGELVAKMHNVMDSYPKPLVKRGKEWFVQKYLGFLSCRNHPMLAEYTCLGDALWDKVKLLPRSYCHGDLYKGNVMKSNGGELYVVDFDTSCEAFSIYDAVLYCHRIDYFEYSDAGWENSQAQLAAFVEGYSKHRAITQAELDACNIFAAIYHYQVQAAVVEIHGLECNDAYFEPQQMEWMSKWLAKSGVNI